MLPIARQSREGFTLIEVLIAMFLSVIGLLAVANVAVMTIDTNMGNFLRDEAVRIADKRINGQIQLTDNVGNATGLALPGFKSLPYASLLPLAQAIGSAPVCPQGVVLSDTRGVSRSYSICWRVTRSGNNAFLAEVWVGWNYKGGAVGVITPTNKKFQHGISTLITKLPDER